MNTIKISVTRDEEILAFLSGTEWHGEQPRPLAGDASNRRYLRLKGKLGPAVLMDAPPEKGEDVTPFVAVTDWLRAQGFSAPEVYAVDAARGLLLLEDLGDSLFARHLAVTPSDQTLVYEAAVDTLVEISGLKAPTTIGRTAYPLAAYDLSVLFREACLLTDWWLPTARGHSSSEDLRADYIGTLEPVLKTVAAHRETLVLRDYHSENLVWLPDRRNTARVGLLDYQDALAGHAAYDLVSLLEDARRDTSPDLQGAMLTRFLDRTTEFNVDTFRRDYAILGAQRNLKIIGIFARLAVRDRKPGYLDLIPRVWRHLMHDLEHPVWSELNGWIATHVPAPDPATLNRVRARVTA
ncbi:MAG: phosphotransferase [Pseudomonadota bacterium]